ncbi:hypothetical protein TRAPUB_7222 [Trametes pubescens]|uniref:DUF4219 domain-containing protein n=1 Tax=Trametes pubescens TaxID=154538 RepID=A0A1M2V3Y6_TRAPU|nr:hypothetical protein TRAPUB_7222 [Trametes pubescens]
MSNFTMTCSSHFPKLNDKNYVKWAMCMEVELVQHKLWDGIIKITLNVQDPVVWQGEYEKQKKWSVQKMNKVRAEIIMQVKDGQFSCMQSCDTMEIWVTLEVQCSWR